MVVRGRPVLWLAHFFSLWHNRGGGRRDQSAQQSVCQLRHPRENFFRWRSTIHLPGIHRLLRAERHRKRLVEPLQSPVERPCGELRQRAEEACALLVQTWKQNHSRGLDSRHAGPRQHSKKTTQQDSESVDVWTRSERWHLGQQGSLDPGTPSCHRASCASHRRSPAVNRQEGSPTTSSRWTESRCSRPEDQAMDKTRQDHRDRWSTRLPSRVGLRRCGSEEPKIFETSAHAAHLAYAVDTINTANTVCRTRTELTSAAAQIYEDPEEDREVRMTVMSHHGDGRSPSV